MKKTNLFTMANLDITEMLSNCESLIPKDLIINKVKWKSMVWSATRGKNILIVGPTRCGKTKAAQSLAAALNRPFFYFNLGSTQDARSALIGNARCNKNEGTVFDESEFVKAIRTKNAIILLDELSRGHHDAWNILMPVLDSTQRYLRLEESSESAVVKVESDVTFIATTNVGNEYTATKVIDKALNSRFPTMIEMQKLEYEQELSLLNIIYPDANKEVADKFKKICRVSDDSRVQCEMDDAKISTFISTGLVIDMAQMALDGFSLDEIAEVCIYPMYDKSGGVDSERLYVTQMTQKVFDTNKSKIKSPVNDPTSGTVTHSF